MKKDATPTCASHSNPWSLSISITAISKSLSAGRPVFVTGVGRRPVWAQVRKSFKALTLLWPFEASFGKMSTSLMDEKTCMRFRARVKRTFSRRQPFSWLIGPKRCITLPESLSLPYVNEMNITSRSSPWTFSRFFMNKLSSGLFISSSRCTSWLFAYFSKNCSMHSFCALFIATTPSDSSGWSVMWRIICLATNSASLSFFPLTKYPFSIYLNLIPRSSASDFWDGNTTSSSL